MRQVVDRLVWLVLALVASAVIVTARVMAPDPVHGSSAQLGLPPCGFQAFTGFKCPGCGLTTCFSYMAHFDPVGAWSANAFGIVLFLSTLVFIPFALTMAWRGARVSETLSRLQAERIVIALALLCLVNFLVRFAFEISGRG